MEEQNIEQTQTEGAEESKTYTQEELDKLTQQEADRRVSKALETAKTKWQEEFKTTLEKEKEEAIRLATLSAEEKEKEFARQKEEEINKREQALNFKELLSDTKDILRENAIPTRFADMLVKENAESTNEAIKVFKDEWQKAVESAVTEKLKGTTPKAGIKANELDQLKSALEKATKLEEKIMIKRQIDALSKQ